MRHDHIQNIIQKLNIRNPVIFNDIDGPGIKNMGIAERTERPEKGILVHLIGYKYPYKGLPDNNAVLDLAVIKRNIFSAMKMLESKYIMLIAGGIMIMPACLKNRFVLPIIEHYKYLIDVYLYKHLLKPHRYSTCVRELYRTFEATKPKKPMEKMVWEMARDLICMIIENDSAYKFRFQDVVVEARRKEILAGKKIMLKEIERLLDLFISREVYDGMKLKWQKPKKATLKMIKWIPQIRGSLAKFFKELNLEEIKLDEADWYFCTMRQDYDFGGKTLKERLKEREEIEGDNWVNFKDLANNFMEQRTESLEELRIQRSKNLKEA